jgi:hypothetical protein
MIAVAASDGAAMSKAQTSEWPVFMHDRTNASFGSSAPSVQYGFRLPVRGRLHWKCVSSDGQITLAVTPRLLWLGGTRRELFTHIFACPGPAAAFLVGQAIFCYSFFLAFWAMADAKGRQNEPSFR